MELIVVGFLILPLLGFLMSLCFKNHQEKQIASAAIFSSALQIVFSFGFFIYWLISGRPSIGQRILTVYESGEFHFGIEVFYDKLTAVYSIVSAILIFIVSIFSRTYMHRESGYKRFYNHFLLFFVGLNLVQVSGNFETFFLGWEIVGITSFLLISFYRDRYLPVRNAMKVLSFYRLGDVALVGAFWFAHHLFHSSVHFESLGSTPLIYDATHHHPVQGLLISLLLVFAASVKSAQMPFSSWLPRAMEGPTTSSAIFYGSLSVHLGVFLLIRSYPIWANILPAKLIIIGVGAVTAIVATFIARVQPTAKTQLAYSSITQIGLMFIEVGLGWHVLALAHFACNALLRTYQLLASPSVMSYLIHEQFFQYDPNKKPMFSFMPKKIRNTLYMWSVKEWNLDFVWFQYIWLPFKKLGRIFHFLRKPAAVILLVMLMLIGVIHYFIYPLDGLHQLMYVSRTYSALALILILIAWTERRSAMRAWIFVAMSQVFFMMSIIQQHAFDMKQIVIYMSGTMCAFVLGLWCLYKVNKAENNVNLNEFHGHVYEHPRSALLFLISTLTMIGFPISPTFLGFDILFSEIETSHRVLLVLSSLTFVILELAVLRIYARVFLGQHVKSYHEVAFRSS